MNAGRGTIIRNARIVTMGADLSPASALALADGTILAVGDEACAQAALPRPAEVVDAQGACILPGFHNARTSLFSQALLQSRVNLFEAADLQELLSLLEKVATMMPLHEWIIGHGWHRNLWALNRSPHRADLDLVAPHHRVVLFSADQNVAWLNTRALKATGIGWDTPDPPGGHIERNPDTGAPTGILMEEACRLVNQILLEPVEESLEDSFTETIAWLHAGGFTSVQDVSPWRGLRQLLDLRERECLSIRVWACPDMSSDREIPCIDKHTGDGDRMLSYGHLAINVDGTLHSHTACRRLPYSSDYENLGMLVCDRERLHELLVEAHQQGWSVRLRAAAEVALELVLAVTKDFDPGRLIVDHCLLPLGDQYAQLQARHQTFTIDALALPMNWRMAQYEWPEDLAGVYCLRPLLENGCQIQVGADYPAMYFDGLSLLANLVGPECNHRQALRGWPEDSHLSIRQALEALTVVPAQVLGQQNWKGTLELGKVADLVVLENNPLEAKAEEIRHNRVLATMVSGNWVFADGLEVTLAPTIRRIVADVAARRQRNQSRLRRAMR